MTAADHAPDLPIFDLLVIGGGINGTGIALFSGVSAVRIRNNEIGTACAGQGGTPVAGIWTIGSNSQIMITGNDLTGTGSTPIAGLPTGVAIINNNQVLDQLSPTIAAASIRVRLSGARGGG